MSKTRFRLWFSVLAGLYVAAFFAFSAVISFYTWHRANTPDAKHGRIFSAEVYYKRTVFVTVWERRLIEFSDYVPYGVPLLMISGFIVDRRITTRHKT